MGSRRINRRAFSHGCPSLWSASLFLLVLICHQASAFFLGETAAEMSPRYSLYEVGSSLHLSCKLLKEELKREFKSDKIEFKIFFKNKTEQIFSIVNTTSFKVEDNYTSSLYIPSLSLDYHRSSVTCQLPGHEFLAHQNIAVALAPFVPRLTGCVVNAWETMTCSWGPNYLHQNHTNANNQLLYIVHWKTNSIWHNITKGPAHKSEQMHNYTWSKEEFQMGMIYSINITATIDHEHLPPDHGLTVMSDIEEISTKKLVKTRPMPIPELHLFLDSEILTLKLEKPNADYPTKNNIAFDYRLCYSTTHMRQVACIISENNTTMVMYVKPNTNYTFQLSCKPSISLDHLWSDNTTFNYSVPISVPKIPAEVPSNGFTITGVDLRSKSRSITLYWKVVPMDFYNGPNFQYVLSTRASPDDEWVFLDNVSQHVYFSAESDFGLEASHVKIVACNIKGCKEPEDPSKSQIYIPSHDKVIDEKPKLIVEKLGHTNEYNLTLAENGYHVSPEQSLTLFYCLAQTNAPACQHSSILQWKTLNTTKSYWIEILKPIIISQEHYLFGVSISSIDGTTTGIEWADCSYIKPALELPEVQKISVVPHSNTGLLVSWHTPTVCNHLYNQAYIRFIKVRYNPENCNAPGKEVVIAGYLQSIVLSDLDSNTRYCVEVIALTSTPTYPKINAVVGETNGPIHPGAIAGICLGVLFGLIMAGYGLYVIISHCRGQSKRYKTDIPIFIPGSDPRFPLSSTSSDLPFCTDGSLNSGFTRMTSVESHDSGVSLPNYRYSDGTLTATTYVDEGSPPCSIPNGHPHVMAIFPPNNISQLPDIPETEDMDEVFDEPVTYKTQHPETVTIGMKPEKNNNRDDDSPVHYTTIQSTPRQYENTSENRAPTKNDDEYDNSTVGSVPKMLSNESLSEYTIVAHGMETPLSSRDHTPDRDTLGSPRSSPARTSSRMLPSNIDYVDRDMNPVTPIGSGQTQPNIQATSAVQSPIMGNGGYVSHDNISSTVRQGEARAPSPLVGVNTAGYVRDPAFMAIPSVPSDKPLSLSASGYVTHADATLA